MIGSSGSCLLQKLYLSTTRLSPFKGRLGSRGLSGSGNFSPKTYGAF